MSTATVAPAPPEVEEPTKGGGKKKLLIGLLVLALGAAAGWWFLLRPPAGEEEPKPGEVVVLEPIQVNLADNHYLRIGLALQAVEGAEHVEGSKALDAVIEMFTGEEKAKLAQPKYRHKLKSELEHELEEAYHEEVMAVYFTDFVTQ